MTTHVVHPDRLRRRDGDAVVVALQQRYRVPGPAVDDDGEERT